MKSTINKEYLLRMYNLYMMHLCIYIFSEVTGRIVQQALTKEESLVHHVEIIATRKYYALIAVQLQTFGLIVKIYTKCGLDGYAVLTPYRGGIDLAAVELPVYVVEKYTTEYDM